MKFIAASVKSLDFQTLDTHLEGKRQQISVETLDDAGWHLSGEAAKKLFDKIMGTGVPLKDYIGGKIYRGILTGLNEAFVIDSETRNRLIREDKRSAEIIKPFLAGRDVKRYAPFKKEKWLIFTRRGIDINQYSAVKAYLSQFKTQLKPKPKGWEGTDWKGRKSGTYKWYEIQDSIDYHLEFEKPKIIIPAIAKIASYAFDAEGFYSNDKTTIIPTEDKYLLALLNSKVCDFILKSIASTKRGGYFEYKPMYLWRLPVRQIDTKNKKEVVLRDRLILLVDQMLTVQATRQENSSDADRKLHDQRVKILDQEINALVYELYGLTKEDIEIVEEEK